MPKKSYITFKDLRAFWDRKTDTIKLTSGDPELAARGWSLTLNRASRDEQILRDALVEAGVIPENQGLSAGPKDPLVDPNNIRFGQQISRGDGTLMNDTSVDDAIGELRERGLRRIVEARRGVDGEESPFTDGVDDADEQWRNVELGELLDVMLVMKGSDLHLSVGTPPQVRTGGQLRVLTQYPPLTAARVKWLAYGALNEDQRAVYEREANIDARFVDTKDRQFRVHVFRDKDNVGAIFRYLDTGKGDGGGTSPRVPSPVQPQGPRAVPAPHRVPAPGRPWTDIQAEERIRMMQEGERVKGHPMVAPAAAKTAPVSVTVPPPSVRFSEAHLATNKVVEPGKQRSGMSGAEAVAYAEAKIQEIMNDERLGNAQKRERLHRASMTDYSGATRERLADPEVQAWVEVMMTPEDQQAAKAKEIAERSTLAGVKQISIVDFLKDQGVHLTRSGKGFVCLCPIHTEKVPSFNVNVEKNMFHCYGCGRSGDIISLVMAMDDVMFHEAVAKLALYGNRDMDAVAADMTYQKKLADEELNRKVAERRALEDAAGRYAKAGEVPDEAPDGEDPAVVAYYKEIKDARGDSEGSYLGYTTLDVRRHVWFDPFEQIKQNNAPGIVVAGAPGSGKSVFALKTAYDLAKRDVSGIYLDPRGDAIGLLGLTEMKKAQLVNLRDGYDGLLNPFTVGEDDGSRVEFVLETLGTLLGGRHSVDQVSWGLLVQAVNEVMEGSGPRSLDAVLTALAGDPDKKQNERATAIAADLNIIRKLPFARLLFAASPEVESVKLGDGLTFITMLGLDAPSTTTPVDAFSNANRLAVAVTVMLTAYARKLLVNAPKAKQKVLLIDDVDTLMSVASGQKMLLEVSRMGRSLNTSLIVTVQDPGMFLDGPLLNAFVTRIVFRNQGPNRIDSALGLLNLAKTNFNRNVVRNLMNGECMLQRPGGDIATLQVSILEKDLRDAIETDPKFRKKG